MGQEYISFAVVVDITRSFDSVTCEKEDQQKIQTIKEKPHAHKVWISKQNRAVLPLLDKHTEYQTVVNQRKRVARLATT